jgi:hypothetical protein
VPVPRKKHRGYFFYIFEKFFSHQSPTSNSWNFHGYRADCHHVNYCPAHTYDWLMISGDLYMRVRKAEHYGKVSNPPIKNDSFPVGNQHYDPCHQPPRCLPASPGWKSVYDFNLCHPFRRFVLVGYPRRLSPYKRQAFSFSHCWYSVP